MKTFILLSSALLLSGAAQAACMSLSSPCVFVTVNSDATAVSCELNDQDPDFSQPGVCMVDLDDVVTQVNSDSTVKDKNLAISKDTPMVIQAWGGRGAKSVSSEGHDNVGGTGGYAQTVTTINDYSLTNFSSSLFYFMGGPGNIPGGSEQSHCGSGGGASSVVSPFDLSLTPDTRPLLSEVMLVAGGGGGAGGFNATGTCDFGGGGQGGPGANGGVAIASTGQTVNAAGVTVSSEDGSCTTNGGGDWNASGGGGSGGGGASGASGVGSWGGSGGGGSSCSPGATSIWYNTFADFTAAAVDSGGGGNTDTASCTAGGGGGGGGYGGGGGGRHGNVSTNSCGGGGGGSYAVKSTTAGGPQTRPSNPISPYGGVFLQFLVDASPSPPPSPIGVTQTLNSDSYQEGDMMTVGVSVQNAQSPTDFFMGALLPDGNTMYFVTELQPLTLHQGFLDDPHSFRSVSDRDVIPNEVIASLPGLISHLMTGAEPIGDYQFFSALTQPNAFGNGSIDNWDFLALDIDPFSVQGPEEE